MGLPAVPVRYRVDPAAPEEQVARAGLAVKVELSIPKQPQSSKTVPLPGMVPETLVRLVMEHMVAWVVLVEMATRLSLEATVGMAAAAVSLWRQEVVAPFHPVMPPWRSTDVNLMEMAPGTVAQADQPGTVGRVALVAMPFRSGSQAQKAAMVVTAELVSKAEAAVMVGQSDIAITPWWSRIVHLLIISPETVDQGVPVDPAAPEVMAAVDYPPPVATAERVEMGASQMAMVAPADRAGH